MDQLFNNTAVIYPMLDGVLILLWLRSLDPSGLMVLQGC